jgi:hypothetical protein
MISHAVCVCPYDRQTSTGAAASLERFASFLIFFLVLNSRLVAVYLSVQLLTTFQSIQMCLARTSNLDFLLDRPPNEATRRRAFDLGIP